MIESSPTEIEISKRNRMSISVYEQKYKAKQNKLAAPPPPFRKKDRKRYAHPWMLLPHP